MSTADLKRRRDIAFDDSMNFFFYLRGDSMNSLTPFIDIIFYCLVEEEHQMSKLSFSPCNCKGSGGMAWRFGACQTFLGSHLKFTGVNVKRPRQHACSHLSSDALIVSCFWCLVFLLYYTPLGLREATDIGRASSPSVSMVFMDLQSYFCKFLSV